MNLSAVAGLLEPVRARQAGQASAHDDDARRRRRVGLRKPASQRAQRCRRANRPGSREQLATGRAGRLRGDSLNLVHEQGACHADERMPPLAAPAMVARDEAPTSRAPLGPVPAADARRHPRTRSSDRSSLLPDASVNAAQPITLARDETEERWRLRRDATVRWSVRWLERERAGRAAS